MDKPEEYYNLLFINLIKTFELSANISLGVIEDPVSKKKKKDLKQAKYYIDLLEMLQFKTNDNNVTEIKEYLKNVILQLHMKYLELSTDPK